MSLRRRCVVIYYSATSFGRVMAPSSEEIIRAILEKVGLVAIIQLTCMLTDKNLHHITAALATSTLTKNKTMLATVLQSTCCVFLAGD